MNLNLPRVFQVCVVVNDLDQAVDHFTNVIGWGPFEIQELDSKDYTFRGRPSTGGKVRVATTAWDSAPALEIAQPLDDESAFAEFLKERGEGLHHVHCGMVDDLDVVLPSLAKDGVEIISMGSLPEYGTRSAFVRTHGVLVELTDMKGASK